MVLVGNKKDLDDRRQVTTEEGQELADKFGMQFYETSAKTGENVDNIFINSADVIAKKIDENYYDLENDSCGIKQGVNRASGNNNARRLDEQPNQPKSKSSCCLKWKPLFLIILLNIK